MLLSTHYRYSSLIRRFRPPFAGCLCCLPRSPRAPACVGRRRHPTLCRSFLYRHVRCSFVRRETRPIAAGRKRFMPGPWRHNARHHPPVHARQSLPPGRVGMADRTLFDVLRPLLARKCCVASAPSRNTATFQPRRPSRRSPHELAGACASPYELPSRPEPTPRPCPPLVGP